MSTEITLPDIFTAGKNFFVGMTFKPHGNMSFHLSVWKAINDPTNIKSCVIEFAIPVTDRYNGGDRMNVLMFGTQAELDSFNTWWTKYTARFPEDTDFDYAMYPKVFEGMHVNGYAYQHGLRDTKAGFHDWVWINKSTSGNVTFINEYWLFEDKAEMLQFKLKGKPEFKPNFEYQNILNGTDTTSYANIDEMEEIDKAVDKWANQ